MTGTALFSAIIYDIEPMPMPRLAHGFRTKRDNQYFKYKADMVKEVHRLIKNITPIDFPCQMKILFKLTHNRRADLDNFLKGACDFLQDAGIFVDDRLIHRVDAIKRHGCLRPSISFCIFPWEEGGIATELDLPPESSASLPNPPRGRVKKTPAIRTESPCGASEAKKGRRTRRERIREIAEAISIPWPEPEKPKRGRPKGSKNVAPKSSARARGKK